MGIPDLLFRSGFLLAEPDFRFGFFALTRFSIQSFVISLK